MDKKNINIIKKIKQIANELDKLPINYLYKIIDETLEKGISFSFFQTYKYSINRVDPIHHIAIAYTLANKTFNVQITDEQLEKAYNIYENNLLNEVIQDDYINVISILSLSFKHKQVVVFSSDNRDLFNIFEKIKLDLNNLKISWLNKDSDINKIRDIKIAFINLLDFVNIFNENKNLISESCFYFFKTNLSNSSLEYLIKKHSLLKSAYYKTADSLIKALNGEFHNNFDFITEKLKESFNIDITIDKNCLNAINDCIEAYGINKGIDYIVENKEIYFIDYKGEKLNIPIKQGLKQALEAKEGLEISPREDIYCILTLFHFFDNKKMHTYGFIKPATKKNESFSFYSFNYEKYLNIVDMKSKILSSDSGQITEIIKKNIKNYISRYIKTNNKQKHLDIWAVSNLEEEIKDTYNIDVKISDTKEFIKFTKEQVIDYFSFHIYEQLNNYMNKVNNKEKIQLQKNTLINLIDEEWSNYLINSLNYRNSDTYSYNEMVKNYENTIINIEDNTVKNLYYSFYEKIMTDSIEQDKKTIYMKSQLYFKIKITQDYVVPIIVKLVNENNESVYEDVVFGKERIDIVVPCCKKEIPNGDYYLKAYIGNICIYIKKIHIQLETLEYISEKIENPTIIIPILLDERRYRLEYTHRISKEKDSFIIEKQESNGQIQINKQFQEKGFYDIRVIDLIGGQELLNKEIYVY